MPQNSVLQSAAVVLLMNKRAAEGLVKLPVNNVLQSAALRVLTGTASKHCSKKTKLYCVNNTVSMHC